MVFLRLYIADMAQIDAPLNLLMKKGVPWEWGQSQQLAFDKFKNWCSVTPVLTIPRQDSELVVRCDASRDAMGVALYQKDEHGFLQPIEFKSKAFAGPQQRLPAHDREALALLYALKSFRHFLLRREFEVQTDNAALSQIFTSKDLSDLYARWYHKLAEFEGMCIQHWPGRKLYCADALSRRRPGAGDDLSPFQVEAGQLYKTAAITCKVDAWQQAVSESASAVPFNAGGRWNVSLTQDQRQRFWLKVTDATELSEAQTHQDPADICSHSAAYDCQHVESAVMARFKETWPELYEQDLELGSIWKTEGDEKWGYFKMHGLLWKHGAAGARLCVPTHDGNTDKVAILKEMHDSKTAGHMGTRRTLAKLMGSFYWKGTYGDCITYVESCHRCQASKIDRRARLGDPRALQVPPEPWAVVHMDWVTGLPTSSEGYDAILVFCMRLD
jgi:hypothetical protein